MPNKVIRYKITGYDGGVEPDHKGAFVSYADYEALTAAYPHMTGAAQENIETYYTKQIEWSKETFGPAKRTAGIIDHISKELAEIAAKPNDLSEWVDVIILAMDGFWRHGGTSAGLMPALLAKQAKNMSRLWPDWRTMSEDSAIEHDRSRDAATPQPAHSITTPWGWVCSGEGDGWKETDKLVRDPELVARYRGNPNWHTIIPLYPHPATSGVNAEMLAALKELEHKILHMDHAVQHLSAGRKVDRKSVLGAISIAIAAAEAQPAAVGWQLVPVEPTEAMLDAYWVQTGESTAMRARTHAYIKRYYQAMLSAAPKPGGE